MHNEKSVTYVFHFNGLLSVMIAVQKMRRGKKPKTSQLVDAQLIWGKHKRDSQSIPRTQQNYGRRGDKFKKTEDATGFDTGH